jgi:hypothetical protein
MNPVRRFVVFFVIVFIPTAALDVWTTELGRQRPNMVELNPMGFMPLKQSILLEIPVLLTGVGLVALGAWWRRETLAKAGTRTFWVFQNEFWFGGAYLGALLLFAPIAICLIRVMAITNNVMHLLWKWSVWDRYLLDPIATWTGLPQFKAYMLMCGVVGLAGFLPIMWLIHRVAGWNRLAGAETAVEKS